jgi:ribosomal protein L12E/L44/L45/RPP1/RPP2
MRPTKLLSLALLLALGTSCKASKSSQAVHVPGEDATIDDYESMLEQSESALAEIGVKAGAFAPAGSSSDVAAGAVASESTDSRADAEAPAPAARQSSGDGSGFNGDCKTLCDLSSTTCELEARICVLAARHSGDARYENACSRAGNDCELAEGIAETSCECEY